MNRETTEGHETARFAAWRSHLLRDGGAPETDLEELEEALSSAFGSLREAGLDPDEAFLVALKRVGEQHPPTREFAHQHAVRILEPPARAETDRWGVGAETWVALGLAALAAILAKALQFLGPPLTEDAIAFYARNESIVALGCVAGYFAWKRGSSTARSVRVAATFVAAAAVINLFPFVTAGSTEVLASVHLPIALWLAVGIAYTAGRWSVSAVRMRFVRFSGELFIHGVLIALGGLVLSAITLTLFGRIGVDTDRLWGAWVLPCGAAGTIVIASWLAESRTRVSGSLAPLLARIFTPLFAFALLALLLTMAWTGTGLRIEREVLIVLDGLLAVVVGLVLYAVSARAPDSAPAAFDTLQSLLVVLALAVDLLALGAIGARIAEFGFTPNRTAALGLNLVLLASLAGSAWFYLRFLRGLGSFAALERWQTGFLPVYAGWAATVAVLFPPLFGYL